MKSEKSVAYRKLEISLISASNLSNRWSRFFKTKVYATVCIGKILETRQKTVTDRDGGKNPVWNYKVEYFISNADVQQATGLKVIIKFYRERSMRKDKCIGQVSISINELFNTRRVGTNRSFRLDKGNGVVNLSYRFGDLINGRARDWKRYIMSVTKRLCCGDDAALLRTFIITAAGILVSVV